MGSARRGHWEGRENRRLARSKARVPMPAAEAHRNAAREAYSDLVPMMRELRTAGQTLQAIADKLNAMGHTTRRGKPWNPVQVDRVVKTVA